MALRAPGGIEVARCWQGSSTCVPDCPPVATPSARQGEASRRWGLARSIATEQQRHAVSERDVQLGAAYIRDALSGRLESGEAAMLGRPRAMRAAFALQTLSLIHI